jgi:ATP-dependent helicase HrpB
MTPLPIDDAIPTILQKLAARTLVVVAPPGSGKTTRIPVAISGSGLLSPDYPNIVVLEPRRIAARAAAAHVARERGWSVGAEVGYHVRFERRFSGATRIRFVTEGILTRQLLADPFLETVGAVVLDEFHERSIHSDLALALLREVRQAVRPELILVVMSATLDAAPVAQFLGNCPIVQAEGRSYPVAVEYRPAEPGASGDHLVTAIRQWAADRASVGHLLVFLPGAPEINRIKRRLHAFSELNGFLIVPLHGSLPSAEQDQALGPGHRRKIILSTNIAETSLTIEGVDTVIDSGLARIVRFDDARGLDRWTTGRISRASALQRAGRAGRTGPGRCIRLWSERQQRGLALFDLPEIHRVDLCATVLALHEFGWNDPAGFPWFESPAPERVASAERMLSFLGAIDGEPRRITPLGQRMLKLPVHPRLARLLLAARDCGRLREGAAVAALLSERDIVIRDTGSATSRRPVRAAESSPSDILNRLDVLAEAESARFAPSLRSRGIDPAAARQAAKLRDELARRARTGDSTSSGRSLSRDDEAILKWLLLAYPDRVVKRRGAPRTGVMIGGRGVRLSNASVLHDPELYLALDAREDRLGGSKEASVGLASMIRLEWLQQLQPKLLRREATTVYDAARHRVVQVTRLWYLDLLLNEDASPAPETTETGGVLADALRHRAADFFHDDPRAGRWLARVDFLRRSLPELGWPSFGDSDFAALLDVVCRGKSSLEEARQVDLVRVLHGRLDPDQTRELAQSAPESLLLPSGRRARLTYSSGRPPVLSVKLQDLLGWMQTPRLARGRVPILLDLLGPNGRTVQITDDLRSFWTTTYHQVRKDLRGRYPKHAWPEDPLKTSPGPRRSGS